MSSAEVQTELKFTYADATKRCASLPDLHKVRNAAAQVVISSQARKLSCTDDRVRVRASPAWSLQPLPDIMKSTGERW